MKTKVTILTLLFCISFSSVSYAQYRPKSKAEIKQERKAARKARRQANWVKFKRAAAQVAGDIFEAGLAAGTSYVAETCGGYSHEDAQQFSRDFCDFAELDRKNTERGLSFINSDSKFQKENVIKDFAFDLVSGVSDNPQNVELWRMLAEANLNYQDNRLKASTEEEKQQVIDKVAMDTRDIFFKAYQIQQDNNVAAQAARKLKMEEQIQKLRGDDFENNDVMNGASYIVAVVQSNDLSEKEKEDYIRRLGLSQSPKEIISIIGPLLDENEEAENRRQEEQRRQKEEEGRRIAEEKRLAEQRAAEERKNALQTLDAIKIDGFAFDVTDLSDEQKLELDEAANILTKYSDVNVLLTGHTCKIGYKSINQRKGLKRAEAAKEYLMSKGVADARITIDSKGETDPLVPNTSKENFKQNRRVEIQIK